MSVQSKMSVALLDASAGCLALARQYRDLRLGSTDAAEYERAAECLNLLGQWIDLLESPASKEVIRYLDEDLRLGPDFEPVPDAHGFLDPDAQSFLDTYRLAVLALGAPTGYALLDGGSEAQGESEGETAE